MPDAATPVSLARKTVRLLLALVVLAALFLLLRWIQRSGFLDRSLQWIQQLGPWAPLVFIVLYVVTVIFFLPASILTAGGGFIWGMAQGSLYVLIAATIAANVTFLLGRHIARNWVAHRMESQPRFKALDEAVAREGWKIVALIRLAPVFPFSITSYAFGLTRIPLWEYFLANFAMIPGTLMYVYFGSVGRDLTSSKPLWLKCTIGLLVAVVVFYITRFARRALSQRIS